MEIFYEDLLEVIDQTYLRQDTSKKEVEEELNKCIHYGFKVVFVSPCYVSLARDILPGEVRVGTTAGFPLGTSTNFAKCFEVSEAFDNGADEVDYVINISWLKSGMYDELLEEMKCVADTAREFEKESSRKKGIKAIIETCFLTDEEKLKALELAVEAGMDFVKTSTGFASYGATEEDVRLLSQASKGRIKIKASGGIRTLDKALSMIKAGASRIGTSSGISILEEARAVLQTRT